MAYKTDFLVIGSGVAGLMFALKASRFGHVTIVTKKELMDSNTSHAQGGIAAVFGELDSFDLHIQDSLASGDGLCNREVAEMVVKNGPERIQELTKLGVQFNYREDGNTDSEELDLGREGGHSRNRIVHALDMTGKEVMNVLVAQVKANPNITCYEDHIAIDLITFSTRMKSGAVTTNRQDHCCGAYVLDKTLNKIKTFSSKITVLATGGTGKVYLYTSNPDIATGDGIAMAYRAGASVANLEFVQFHPTCLYHPAAKNFLISEAVRGEGGILVDGAGRPFMKDYSPQKDLACRDVVSRAIDSELKKSGADSVFLDITHADPDFVKKRFPNIYQKCLSLGIDMTQEPIPVVPAAHYMCGGVATDLYGRTDVRRLYALGETACTGLHGANRLASNSLLEALVYAHSAAAQAEKDLVEIDFSLTPDPSEWDEAGSTPSDEGGMVTHNWDEIRRFMWEYVGVVRSNRRLERAQRRIDIIQKEIQEYYWDFNVTSDLVELRNIATVAELIIRCARLRKESRGLHYTIEYPEKNDSLFLKDTVIKRHLL
jgi:L-aspartate oxidase